MSLPASRASGMAISMCCRAVANRLSVNATRHSYPSTRASPSRSPRLAPPRAPASTARRRDPPRQPSAMKPAA